ncbi:endonuclease [Bifidobacterium ramosum]|uniref:Endonuclease n=1 Tax=Bifidobacterium ramosum TaxID=1798158 RepID=A0A6L4X580_9BIFI|nr:YqaJ viral recombinase family protein [Bifidobacterium ramosum]KAB8289337.1 endonuclease [Bifidobacterium ramosum]NEG71035.1 endonuclease [Bifidobacterium ramosum]
MRRPNLNDAAKSTGCFDVHRFNGSGTTKASREDAWHAFRKLGVGGSDMSTILGLNQYATPYDLWLEKTGRVEPDDISDRWAVVKGNALEDALRTRFRMLHPELLVTKGTDISLVSKAHPCMHASLDGFLYDAATGSWGVLEIKTANASRGRTDWHDEDGNLIAPDYYMAQVTHYMAVTGFQWGYFYADIGESEPVEVRFERDDEDCATVVKAAEEFWGFVQRDEMPALTGVDVAKAYPQDDGSLVQVDDSEFDRLCALYKAHAEAETAEKKAKDLIADQLKPLIGEHKGVLSLDWKATYTTQTRPEHLVKASTSRVLRVSGIKPKTKERN